MSDPYQTLGIARNASDDEIKKAYRTLSRKYHPDANINNPNKAQAEEKFKQVQAAYQQIMKERTEGYSGSDYGDGMHSGWYDPFGFGSSAREDRTSEADETDMHMKAAANYINSGHFREALNVLAGISPKNARWYYYSAVANSGIGNNVVALEHAQRAASMEPDNRNYQELVQEMQYGGNWYQTRRRSYESPSGLPGSFCLKLCIANMICSMCCGGGGFWYGTGNNYNNYGNYGNYGNVDPSGR